MKLTVTLLVLATVTHAAKVTKNSNKIVEKTDKRELSEGNAGVEKRAPALHSASPSLTAGVEYADSSNSLSDQSPTQQIYSTPGPQFSKVSDLLTAQGPSYQAAIASHLYSPVSVYQSRFGQPTTYEVSAPVPSNLAYSEHRLSLPSPNSIQYNPKPVKQLKPNFEQPQVLIQPYEQSLAQQVTASPLNQYSQAPQQFYNQYQPNQQYVQQPNLQTVTYHQQVNQARNQPQPEQRDLKHQPAPSQVLEKQVIQEVFNDKQQNALSYARFSVNQPTPSPAYDQSQLQQAHQQPLPQAQLQSQQLIQPHQYQQPQLVQPQQYQQSQLVQPQQYQQSQPQQYLQSQPLQISYQLQHPAQQLAQVTQAPQVQYQSQQQAAQPLQPQLQLQHQQPQIQYQEQPQYLYQQFQDQALQQQALSLPQQFDQSQYQNIQSQQYQQYQQPPLFNFEKPELSKQSIPDRQSYVKQAPIIQPKLNLNQPQGQSLGHQPMPAGQPALPTFPPVQYFGKFAQSLFGDYQH